MGPVKVSNYDLRHLEEMPRVKVGELWLNNVTQQGIDSLAKLDSRNYHVTRIYNCPIDGDALDALAPKGRELPVGPELYVKNTKISSTVMSRFPWKKLKDVRLTGTGLTFDEFMDVAPIHPKAIVASSALGMSADWNWSTHRGWAPIGLSIWTDIAPSSLTEQQVARLTNVEGIRVDSKEPLGEFLSHFQQHQKLKILIAGVIPPNTPIIEQVGRLPYLERLELNFCNPRTRMSIQPLSQLTRLKRLEMTCTPFGDESMHVLANLESLEELTLYGAHTIEGPGLQHLFELKNLQKVRIRSRRDWNESFDTLVKLKQQVERITLIDVVLSPTNLTRYRSLAGATYLDW